MSEAGGRRLPNARLRRFMLAIQEVTGQSGLTTILRQAGLQRYAGALPPQNAETGMAAAEFAALTQALENYYGRGARGTLNRIGHEAFALLCAGQPLTIGLYRLIFPLLASRRRSQIGLSLVARELAAPAGRVIVQRDDQRWSLLDYEGDATFGRARDTAICWATLGEVQAALQWATGREYDVAETACKAQGAPACRFEIGGELG